MTPEQTASELERVADDVLTFMALSDWGTVRDLPRQHKLKPGHFTRAQPFLAPELFGDDYQVWKDALPTDLYRPLDVTLLVPDSEGYTFQLQRIRRMSSKDMRGRRPRGTLPEGYEQAVAYVDAESGRTSTARVFIYRTGKGYYTFRVRDGVPEDETVRIRVACGVQFNTEMSWTVALGWVGHPTILIPTDPVGAREVFALRDIPNGKKRRAALRHWVTSHYRRNRRGDASFVRAHLRGAQEFTWNGLYCRIAPSIPDLRQNQQEGARG